MSALGLHCEGLWLGSPGADAPDASPAPLGQICFGALPPGAAALPSLFVAAPALGAGAGWLQRWVAGEAVRAGHCGAVHYRHTPELLFGCLQLTEFEIGETPPLEAAAEAAYRAVFATLVETGFPHLVRVWNYITDINRVSHGLERYRQFNVGRQRAFLAAGRAAEGQVPAACALGTAAGPLTVAFLASRMAPLAVENPRQVSAYRYPNEYGPVSPTFSRAALLPGAEDCPLFVSGTAAIVGHRSLHPGDVAAQARESLANIRAVLEEAGRRAPGRVPALAELAFTVYLRHPADLDAVRAVLAEALPASVTPMFVQADVCRAELLVEIEASGGHSLELIR